MRFAHAADIHLGHRQYGLKQREVDADRSFQHFLDQTNDHDVDAILLPGDLFDSRDVRPKTLQWAEEALESIDVPVVVSPGNHDQNLSSRRDVTWLQYLNDKGLITLLSAEMAGDRASFAPTEVDTPRKGGGGYVDLPGEDGPIRVFGLQYRGAYVERDLLKVADGIRAVNESEGEPAGTVLMAHFGVDDAVPDLGAHVSYSALTEFEDLLDYLALGHIHKQFTSGTFAYNPGSLEAFDVQEGRWDGEHGYYVVDTTEWEPEHHLSKRRPYYTTEFDVSDYPTFDDLRVDFENHVRSVNEDVESVCERHVHLAGDGSRREPIVNVRLSGTLLLDHPSFDLDTLCELAKDELEALYVQPTDNTERKAIQDLLGDLEREEAFNPDGTVNTDAMQDRVFSTIAEESRYAAESDAVASTLDELEERINERDHSLGDIAEYLRERRRELFPEGPAPESSEDETDEQQDDVEAEEATVTTDGGGDVE